MSRYGESSVAEDGLVSGAESEQPSPGRPAGGGPGGFTDVARQRVLAVLHRFAPLALRVSLALVFVWFGALKIVGDSPVSTLIAATVPWVPIAVMMAILGWVEVVIGLSLLIGWPRRLTLVALTAHLSGTFLTFIVAPQLMVRHGNPLLLTSDGEFVLKNVVLIASALVLLAHQQPGRVTTAQ
jgi:putative oxidoreductase